MNTIGPIILVVGARPNFMKIAPLHSELESRGIDTLLLHTGQHYDEKMSKIFFEELGMPEPDIYLGIGSGSHATQTAKVMVEFEKVCLDSSPSMVVVVGDVNSTVACALVAAKLHIPCAHVEAGLRSFDRKMPEEINRLVTDAIADILLTPSLDGNEHLENEGVDKERIHFVGNIMIDSLFNNLKRAKQSNILEQLELTKKNYALITLHRPSNVDDRDTFQGLISTISHLSNHMDVVFPMHPRTFNRAKEMDLMKDLERIDGIRIIEPLGYLEFISLMESSKIVLTDSGGLQEETTALGIPCLTVRENTERPITITEGTNELAGTDPNKIIGLIDSIISTGGKEGNIPKYWDGNTASRIADILIQSISN